METKRDPEAYALKCFEQQTAEHQMTVLHDDGVYRHLCFSKPGTNAYRYDLVTWPGYLATSGDMGEYVFSRLEDMFKFFAGEAEGINPQYWGEKLRGPGTDTHRRYSTDAYRRMVTEWCEQQVENMEADKASGLKEAVNDSLLSCEAYDINEAMTLIREFWHDGVRIEDYWEWADGLMEYDHRFLWLCWGIKRGVQMYYTLGQDEPTREEHA